MRVIIRILALLALLLAFLVPAGSATAAPADSERFQTFAFETNTCNGESIAGEGTLHTVTKEQKDGTFLTHFKVQAKGVGVQGNEYVMNRIGQFTSTSGGQFSTEARVMLISKGSAPNYAADVQFDSTGNFSIEVDCRG